MIRQSSPGRLRPARRFVEFFTANIRNRNTRRLRPAVTQFFRWCEARGIGKTRQDEPGDSRRLHRAAPVSPPTVKQYLTAIRMLFGRLVTGQVIRDEPPRSSVRGPK